MQAEVVLKLVLAAVGGYLLGAIPVGYLAGRAWGVDVRKHGSGRTGGTNVLRATGRMAPFVITGVGDVAKGVLAVWLGRYVLGSDAAAALAGMAAVAGHNWSLFLGWRGGAGGATAAAALVALDPVAGTIVALLGLSMLYVGRYASLATITVGIGAVVTLGSLAIFEPVMHPWQNLLFGLPVAVIVLIALKPNLKRLADGTERRITFW